MMAGGAGGGAARSGGGRGSAGAAGRGGTARTGGSGTARTGGSGAAGRGGLAGGPAARGRKDRDRRSVDPAEEIDEQTGAIGSAGGRGQSRPAPRLRAHDNSDEW